jgi:translation initiation factor 5B
MKVDRLYGWKACPNAPIGKALRQQNEDVKMEFNTRLTDVCGHYNLLLFMKKKNF